MIELIVTLIQSILTGLLQGGIYSLLGMGLTIIFGVMGILNFAQADFLMLGMYVTLFAVLGIGISPLFLFFLLFPLFFIVGAVIHRGLVDPLLDAPEDAQLILTFGLALVIQSATLGTLGSTPRSIDISYATTSLFVGPFALNQAKLIAFGFAVATAVVAFAFLQRTEFGRALRATANNDTLAQYSGVNVRRMYMAAFGIGAALTASAGALVLMYRPVSPSVGFDFIIIMFVVVILGGLGSVKGAFVAGLLIGVVEQVAVIWIPLELQSSIAFLLFLVIVLLKPEGLYGTATREV